MTNADTMSAAAAGMSAQRLRWVWVVAVAALLLAVVLAGLRLSHQQQQQELSRTLNELAHASDDLAQGYLHLHLDSGPDSPWQRGQGLALLEQALRSYQRLLAQGPGTGPAPAADAAAFQAHIARVRALLQVTPLQPQQELSLRLSIYRLSEQAAIMEVQARTGLSRALQQQERLFRGVLLAAVLLLLIIAALLGLAARERSLRTRQLQDSEARFHQLCASLSSVYWLRDAQTQALVYLSPVCERVWGRSAADVWRDPAPWPEDVLPEDQARLAAARTQLLRGTHRGDSRAEHREEHREEYREEFRIIRPDGQLRWIEERARAVPGVSGQVEYIAGLATDISARKQLEQNLQQQEQVLQQVLRIARLGTWTLDAESDRLLLSPEVCAMLELLPGTVLPRVEALAMYPPRWRPLIEAALERCLVDGTAYAEELQIRTASGRYLWVRVLGQARRRASGVITGVEGSVQNITEQKQATALLSLGHQRFQQFADAMPLVVWSAEPDGSIDYLNRSFTQLTGLTANEASSWQQLWWSALHPDDQPLIRRAWREAMLGSAPLVVELRLRASDDSYRWYEAQAVPTRNDHGQMVKWYGSASDIHARKLSEDRARALAERLTHTLESISDGFFTLDDNWCFDYVNAETERLLASARADLLGHCIWDVYPATRNSAFEHHYRRAREQGCKMSFEAYYEPMACWFRVSAYPLDGGVAVYFQDVSIWHEREQQLHLLETCLAHMQDMVMVTEAEPQDEPGPRIVFVNDAFTRRTGYSRAEVLGRSPRFLQGPNTQRAALDRMRTAMQAWQPVRVELINYTKSGEEFWLEIELVPVADPQGWYTHWVAVERDITRRKTGSPAPLPQTPR